MKISVLQEPLRFTFTYDVDINGEKNYLGIADRTILPKLRRILLSNNDDNVVGSLTEVNWFYKMVSSIPILKLFLYRSKFFIKINEKECGEIFVKASLVQGKAIIIFNGKRYTLYSHSSEGIARYSVFCEEKQVGLVTRDPYSAFGNDVYSGEFDFDTNEIFNSLLILFIDIVWNTVDIPTSFNAYSTEYKTGIDTIFGVKLEKGWKPKER